MPTEDIHSSDPRDSRIAKDHPKSYLLAHAVVGVVLVALLLWAFGTLADEIPEQGWMTHLDRTVTTFAGQRSTEWGETIFVVVSLFGIEIMLTLVALFTCLNLLRRDWLRAGTLAIGVGAGALIDTGLKLLFHRGRPELATEFITHRTWSFPSGHAFNSMVAYGLLVALSTRRRHDWRYQVLAAFVILMVGISRVYLGVHYLSDVIAGWLAGGVWLFICITGYRFARQWLPKPGSSRGAEV